MALTDTEAQALNVRVEATLGDDLTANTEDRILEAVWEWCEADTDERHMFDLPYTHNLWKERVWHNRDGQPWQADIELHVAEWRAPARPFATDDALAMTLLVGFKNWDIYRLSDSFTCHIRSLPEGDKEWAVVLGEAAGATIAEAVCRAWLAVAEGKEG